MSTLQHHLTGRSSEMSSVVMTRKRKSFMHKNLGFDQTIDTKKPRYTPTTISTNPMGRFPNPSTLSSVLSTLPSSQKVYKKKVLAEQSNNKPIKSGTNNNKPRIHKVFGVKKAKKQVNFASITDVVFFYKDDEPGVFTNFKVLIPLNTFIAKAFSLEKEQRSGREEEQDAFDPPMTVKPPHVSPALLHPVFVVVHTLPKFKFDYCVAPPQYILGFIHR